MSQSLIVPIDVAALCVGNTDVNGSTAVPYGTKDFARLAADFSMIPYIDGDGDAVNYRANVAQDMLAAPFNSVGKPLQKGIHLHWSLPDAVSHGASDADGNIIFPEAPNRWLVVRIATNNGVPAKPLTSVKGWIVESDTLWNPPSGSAPAPDAQNAMSLAVPTQPIFDPNVIPNRSSQMMGRVFAYEAWQETPNDPAIAKHTALGYGIPTYAAAYAHCVNVFGLYDPLTDLDLTKFPPASSRISYMVAGWYSDATNDPLATMTFDAKATNAEKLAAVNDAFNWNFAIDASTPFPASTLCSGLLTAITWDPVNTHYIKPRPNTPIDVAIGNTTAEALSALIASRPQFATQPNVERLLNALQLNVLPKLGNIDGLAQLEAALHQNDFGASSAGKIWTIKRRNAGDSESGDPVTGNDLLEAATALEESLPADLAAALDSLNDAQAKVDRAGFEIDSMRGQIFIDWYKYMILEYPSVVPQPVTVTADEAFHYIKDEVKALNARIAALQQLTNDLTTQIQGLFIKLDAEKKYILSSLGAPRYWHPAEPVLLFSGADVQPPNRNRPLGASADDYLLCRLSGSIVSAISAGGSFTAATSQLPKLPASPNKSYVDILAALMGEAFFLDINQAWVLAAVVAARGGAGNPATANLAAFVANVQGAQKAFLSGTTGSAAGNIAFTGVAPSPVGVKGWSSPWIPLIMQWEVNYYPFDSLDDGGSDAGSYPPDFIRSNFALDGDAIDLLYNEPVPAQLPAAEIYRGTTVLARNTEINLKSLINTYITTHPGDRINTELQFIRDNLQLSMMAQSLDGFNQALVMRRQTLQLPVFDPLGMLNMLDHYRFSNVVVRGAVADKNDYAPTPQSSYDPLRAGYMTISRVRIIDVFGQKRDIESPNVVRSETLIPVGDRAMRPVIALPPRLAQPSRLQFRWLSATSSAVEMSSDPASSPVFGWVLFNHLDDNLMIYDADGNALGSFNTQGPFWQGAPGDSATYNTPIDVVFAGANPHLKAFALGLNANPNAKGFLIDMLAAIDRAVTMIEPGSYQEDQGLAVLIGRPLALVRASLGLELQGLPAINQSWDSFAKAIDNDTIDGRDDGAFPSVQFPVRLGDLSRVNDGLVGYFIEDGTANAFRTFYAASSRQTSNGVVPPAADQLTVVAEEDAPATLLTMLVDPRAGVHATTGFLPVKSISIPPYMFGNALANMAVTFLTTPVLTSLASLSLPVPKERGYTWSWVMNNPAAKSWDVTSEIKDVNSQAAFSDLPQKISEGWLKLGKDGDSSATSNSNTRRS